MAASIDWQSQWEAHALNFREGHLHLDLSGWGFATLIRLKAGPGFGDMSHPTTRLMLNMMHPHVLRQTVIDIGSGSGILTFAALGMGAEHATGIEIDPEAITHAQESACLNPRGAEAIFVAPEAFTPPGKKSIVLMNMIRTEQKIAWESVPSLHQEVKKVIISGILQEERELYLEQARGWGWVLHEEQELNGWLGFYFITRAQNIT